MNVDTEIRLSQVDPSVQPPIEILAVVKGYDPRLDLKWDGRQETWGLWRQSELGPLVFVCTVGPRLDGRILMALQESDTRVEGHDGRFLQRMKEAKLAAKRVMHERSEYLHERIEHALAADSLEVQAKRAEEVMKEFRKEQEA